MGEVVYAHFRWLWLYFSSDDKNSTQLTIEAVDKYKSSVTISIFPDDDLITSATNVFEFSGDYVLGFYLRGNSLATAKGYVTNSGIVRFSRLTKTRITGEFSFYANGYMSTSESSNVTATEGRFDMYY